MANQVMGAKASGYVTLEDNTINYIGTFPCSELFSGLADGYTRQVFALVQIIDRTVDNYSCAVYLIGQVRFASSVYTLDSFQVKNEVYMGTAGTRYDSLLFDIDAGNLRVVCDMNSFTPGTCQGFTTVNTSGP